jgi:hypothetical protein
MHIKNTPNMNICAFIKKEEEKNHKKINKTQKEKQPVGVGGCYINACFWFLDFFWVFMFVF